MINDVKFPKLKCPKCGCEKIYGTDCGITGICMECGYQDKYESFRYIRKNILHQINFERGTTKLKQISEGDRLEFSFTQNIATQVTEKVDALYYDLLYQVYKDTDCDKVIVLDKSEFKRFIDLFLPQYIQLIRKENENHDETKN